MNHLEKTVHSLFRQTADKDMNSIRKNDEKEIMQVLFNNLGREVTLNKKHVLC